MAAALDYMRRGELVPDATVWAMVRERAACLHCDGGFLLDGFPRTLSQAQSLRDFLRQEKLTLNAVIDYQLPIPEIVARLSGRQTCPKCKAVFHVINQPPKQNGICDYCGSPLFQREDDRPESIQVRLAAYENSTAPLIDFYRKLDLLLCIPATGSPEQICARTLAALNLQNEFPPAP